MTSEARNIALAHCNNFASSKCRAWSLQWLRKLKILRLLIAITSPPRNIALGHCNDFASSKYCACSLHWLCKRVVRTGHRKLGLWPGLTKLGQIILHQIWFQINSIHQIHQINSSILSGELNNDFIQKEHTCFSRTCCLAYRNRSSAFSLRSFNSCFVFYKFKQLIKPTLIYWWFEIIKKRNSNTRNYKAP